MHSNLSKLLAKRIKELRQERGLTQVEAARKCDISFKYYQEYEGSHARDMRLSTMHKIARGFDTTLPKLLDFE